MSRTKRKKNNRKIKWKGTVFSGKPHLRMKPYTDKNKLKAKFMYFKNRHKAPIIASIDRSYKKTLRQRSKREIQKQINE